MNRKRRRQASRSGCVGEQCYEMSIFNVSASTYNIFDIYFTIVYQIRSSLNANVDTRFGNNNNNK